MGSFLASNRSFEPTDAARWLSESVFFQPPRKTSLSLYLSFSFCSSPVHVLIFNGAFKMALRQVRSPAAQTRASSAAARQVLQQPPSPKGGIITSPWTPSRSGRIGFFTIVLFCSHFFLPIVRCKNVNVQGAQMSPKTKVMSALEWREMRSTMVNCSHEKHVAWL